MEKVMEKAEGQTSPREGAFMKRLNQVCDDSRDVPPYNRGRLVWIKNQLQSRFNIRVSNETVRKWLAGEARPRSDKMRALAEILSVDEGWLALGLSNVLSADEKRGRRMSSNGAVNIVAGFIQISGGNCAVPEDDDPLGDFVDLYAIIDRRQVRIGVSAVIQEGGEGKIFVPNDYEKCSVVVVHPTGPTKADFYLIPSTLIAENGTPRGENIEVPAEIRGASLVIGGASIRRIVDFKVSFAR